MSTPFTPAQMFAWQQDSLKSDPAHWRQLLQLLKDDPYAIELMLDCIPDDPQLNG